MIALMFLIVYIIILCVYFLSPLVQPECLTLEVAYIIVYFISVSTQYGRVMFVLLLQYVTLYEYGF